MENVERPQRSFLMQLLFSAVISVLVALLLSVLFGLLIVAANMGDGWLMPIKQIINAVSLFTGCMLGFKGRKDGWKKGIIVGLVYSVLAFVIFSLMDTEPFSVNITLLWDILLGTAMGVICGIIAVNLKKA